jgi:hypothetical protein
MLITSLPSMGDSRQSSQVQTGHGQGTNGPSCNNNHSEDGTHSSCQLCEASMTGKRMLEDAYSISLFLPDVSSLCVAKNLPGTSYLNQPPIQLESELSTVVGHVKGQCHEN